jgi:aspartate/methionine/tyrosine aminotransferase
VSDDVKLQKVILGPDWIDLSFGEPKIVTNALFRQINRFGDPFKMPTIYDLPKWEYQPAAGKPDLVQILEEKYGERVVVCNGAKQALAAALYAFKQSGCSRLFYGRPYYPANPSIASSIGISTCDSEHESVISSPVPTIQTVEFTPR